MKRPLNVSRFLKKPKIQTKHEYDDLDSHGYGHREDQFLSPRLAEYLKKGEKYNIQTLSEEEEEKVQFQVSYGRHEYNLNSYLLDGSSDEEEMKDY